MPVKLTRRGAWLVLLCVLVGLCTLPAQHADAKTATLAPPAGATAAPAAPTPADLRNLEATLQSPAQVKLLLGQIRALIAVRQANGGAVSAHKAPGSALVAHLSASAARIGAGVSAIGHLGVVNAVRGWESQLASDPNLRWQWLRSAGLVGGILATALLAAIAMRLALRRTRLRLQALGDRSLGLRLMAMLGTLCLGLVPVALVVVVGYGALAIVQASLPLPAPARSFALAVIDACALVGAVRAVTEALLAPGSDGARRIGMTQETATYWLVWVLRLARFGIYGWFALRFALDAGLGVAAYALLLRIYGLLLTALLIMLILQNRQSVAKAIAGDHPTSSAWGRLRARAGAIWHIPAVAYLMGAYLIWASGTAGGFVYLIRASLLSLLIMACARGLDVLGTRLTHRFLAVGPALEQRLPGLQRRVNLYAPALIVAGRLLIGAIALLLVLQAWGLAALALLATPIGQRVIGAVVTIAIVLMMAVCVWEAISFAIGLYFSRPGPDGTPVDRSARIRTLLPLLRKTLAGILGVTVVLVVLATIGVNIAPLLAGAGIAGVAIGFGAQSLVKDVITGMFVLMRDAVAVGDVVAVAGHSGLVEEVTIRSIRLRDQGGNVFIVPFSEVTTVQNMTKDFSYALFNLGIAYREDVDAVIVVLTELADGLREDPAYAPVILAPMEMIGLDSFADSAVILKFRIKTRPIQQWNVMREFNRRLKRRFDELNIELPFPHRTVYFGADQNGGAPPAHLLLERAAARAQDG
jgi:small-conductance mechanosensitive channel